MITTSTKIGIYGDEASSRIDILEAAADAASAVVKMWPTGASAELPAPHDVTIEWGEASINEDGGFRVSAKVLCQTGGQCDDGEAEMQDVSVDIDVYSPATRPAAKMSPELASAVSQYRRGELNAAKTAGLLGVVQAQLREIAEWKCWEAQCEDIINPMDRRAPDSFAGDLDELADELAEIQLGIEHASAASAI